MITSKYRMTYVKPIKPYLMKLQRIKDKMAYALKTKFIHLQQQDESPSKLPKVVIPSLKSFSQRKDSNSSLNTFQPKQGASTAIMKASVEAFMGQRI